VKTKFLAIYDYGTGGLWAVISARSSVEIVEKYPALKVLDTRPGWMTDETYAGIASRSYLDINDEPPEWVRLTLKEQP